MTTLPLQNVKIRIRPENGKIYFTVSDIQKFHEWPEGPLIELINGELFLVPSPTIEHQEISSEIHYQLKAFLKEHPIGKVFPAPVDVILTEEDLTIPDIVFILDEKKKIIKTKNIKGIPDFIIEIVSSNKKQDYVEKKELYEKSKVNEYWIVDPHEEKVLVYLLTQDMSYKEPKEYKITDSIPVKMIEGLIIKIKD